MPVDITAIEDAALDRADANEQAQHTETLQGQLKDAVTALYEQRDKVHNKIPEATQARSDLKSAEKDYGRVIEHNKKFLSGNLPDLLSKVMVTVFGIVPAWVLDFLVFSAVTTFFMGLAGFSGSGFILWIGKILFPMGIIAFEIGISISRYRAPDAKTRRLYTWIAIALITVLSTIALALFVADNFVEAEDLTLDLILLAIGYTILAPLPHVVILLGGKDSYEGKAYMFFLRLRRRVRKLSRIYDDHLKDVLALFRPCERMEHSLRETHNYTPAPALYTAAARTIINEAFGAEVIPPPSEPASAPPSPNLNGASAS